MQKIFIKNSKIIHRIAEYIQYKDVSLNSFDKLIGTSTAYISKLIKSEGSVGSDILEKIFIACPDINPLWLLTGEGDMLKSSSDYKKIEPIVNKVNEYSQKPLSREFEILLNKYTEQSQLIGKLNYEIEQLRKEKKK